MFLLAPGPKNSLGGPGCGMWCVMCDLGVSVWCGCG